jgi:hypothetical protein
VGNKTQKRSSSLVTVLLGAGLVVAVSLCVVGSASAHIPTLIYTQQEVVTSSPGETVELDVVIGDNGGYEDSGVERIEFIATYETEYVSVVDVEPAGWLDQGQQTNVYTNVTVDDTAGTVNVTEWRQPPRQGVIAESRFVTLTLQIAPDAPRNSTEIAYHDSDVTHVNGWYIRKYVTNTTIALGDQPPQATSDTTADDGALPTGFPYRPIIAGTVVLYLGAIAIVWKRG